MNGDVFEYIIIGLFAVMAVFSFLIGSDKMVKIIIGNYIIGLLLLSLSMSFNVLIYFFDKNSGGNFMGISFDLYKNFFINGHITILLIVYIGTLILLFTRSFIEVKFPNDDLRRNLLFVALIPWTIFSLIFTLEIVLFGTKLFNIDNLVKIAEDISNNPVMYNFIFFTPLWMLVHAVGTLFITTELDIKYNTQSIGFPGSQSNDIEE